MPKLKSKFIIWTVRRTGGTRFTTKLTDMSIYPVAEHEPFNIDRMFGKITKRFIDEKK